MKIVIIGAGGREHAISNQLRKDIPNADIIAIPGNAGMPACIPIPATDVKAITQQCERLKPDLAIVASDDPLALGLVDLLSARGIRVFGPTQKASEIEWSKSFSKGFMKRHKIPTAAFKTFNNFESAASFVAKAPHPIVIKANGLALGKGVVISQTAEESFAALQSMMLDKKFGASGENVVIEEFLTGPEITLMAFTDGKNFSLMPTSQDHKRAYDGDKGPNTGGMGAFSPAKLWSKDIEQEVTKTIVKPTITGLDAEGRTFKGVLYFGLMATQDGVKVIEYNARFGDPECQTVLPLLKTNFLDALNGCIDGNLDKVNIQWKDEASLCVVVASNEYPGEVKKGLPVKIGELNPNVKLIHSGTKATSNGIVTNGGRVFCITGTAPTLEAARKNVYAEIDKVQFPGARYRRDIGGKAKNLIQTINPTEKLQETNQKHY